MLIFIKLGKSFCILIPCLFIVIVVHSIVHFKLGTDEVMPKKLMKILWPSPEDYDSEASQSKAIVIKGFNLFLFIFFFVIIISFTLGNLYSWLIAGDANGLNKKVVIGVLIIGFLAAQRLVGIYMQHLRGGK